MANAAVLNKFLKKSFGDFPQGAKIFEIGSASGTNSWFLNGLGYDVTTSDATQAFVDSAKQQGLKSVKFNAREDNFEGKYSGIVGFGAFDGFDIDTARMVLEKCYKALQPGGRIAFNTSLAEADIRQAVSGTDFRVVKAVADEQVGCGNSFVLENPGI